jgi:hypothetical protein
MTTSAFLLGVLSIFVPVWALRRLVSVCPEISHLWTGTSYLEGPFLTGHIIENYWVERNTEKLGDL